MRLYCRQHVLTATDVFILYSHSEELRALKPARWGTELRAMSAGPSRGPDLTCFGRRPRQHYKVLGFWAWGGGGGGGGGSGCGFKGPWSHSLQMQTTPQGRCHGSRRTGGCKKQHCKELHCTSGNLCISTLARYLPRDLDLG